MLTKVFKIMLNGLTTSLIKLFKALNINEKSNKAREAQKLYL